MPTDSRLAALVGVIVALTLLSTVVRTLLIRHLGSAPLRALLFLFRFSAVVALCFLLRSPVVKVAVSKRENPIVAILVDGSLSVDPAERSRAVATAVKEARRAGRALMWVFGRDLRSVPTDFSAVFNDHASRLSHAVCALVKTRPADSLILVADGQDTDPLPDETIAAALKGSRTRLIWCPVRSRKLDNIAISVSPSHQFLFPGEKGKVTVTVRASVSRARTVRLALFRSGRRIRSETLSVGPDSVASRDWILEPGTRGWTVFTVTVDTADSWGGDNRAGAALWTAPTNLRALLIASQPTWDVTFVKRALESDHRLDLVSLIGISDGKFFTAGPGNLTPVRSDWIRSFHAAIVFPSLDDLSDPVDPSSFGTFVRQGGGLIAVGKAVDQLLRTTQRLSRPIRLGLRIAPGRLETSRDDPLMEMVGSVPPFKEATSLVPLTASVHLSAFSDRASVLAWWEEGPGCVVTFPVSELWQSVMAPGPDARSSFDRFWRRLVRFVAKPEKSFSGQTPPLLSPKEPPEEWTMPADRERLTRLALSSGGAVLSEDQIPTYLSRHLRPRKDIVFAWVPVSSFPFLYILLSLFLLLDWYLARRMGLP